MNSIRTMKRIFAIIFAVYAFAACAPDNNSTMEFKAESIVDTKWNGSLKIIDGTAVKSNSEVTVRFVTENSGKFTQKRSGSSSKESYDLSYSVSGKTITFDCPVINGTWEVTNYMEQTMTLTLQPSRNSIMTLVKE